MKTIGAFGVVVIATIALLEPAQAGSRGGGSRGGGGGRSFAPARSYSGSGGHFAGRSGNFSRGGARFSGGSSRFTTRGSAGYYAGRSGNFSRGAGRLYTPPTRFSSGATFRNRDGAVNRDRAFNPGTYSRSGSRLVGNRNREFNPDGFSRSGSRLAGNRNRESNPDGFSRSGSRLAGNRTTARNGRGFNNGERIIARRSGNWRRNWDRNRDHYWRGHRCRWVNNSWVIFATGFYPYGWGYPYGYGYGYYPAGSYYDSGYYGDSYVSDEYAQESAQSGYTNDNLDSEVSRVQAALARQGYYRGAIDGSLGPATRNALRRYQRAHGLDVTGQIDQRVMDALGVR